MAKGTIAKLTDRGFGFIKTEEGVDFFFHSNELEGVDFFFHSNELEGVEFNNLSEGQEVEFEKGQGRDGRPAALKVRLTQIQVDDDSGDVGDGGGDDD